MFKWLNWKFGRGHYVVTISTAPGNFGETDVRRIRKTSNDSRLYVGEVWKEFLRPDGTAYWASASGKTFESSWTWKPYTGKGSATRTQWSATRTQWPATSPGAFEVANLFNDWRITKGIKSQPSCGCQRCVDDRLGRIRLDLLGGAGSGAASYDIPSPVDESMLDDEFED